MLQKSEYLVRRVLGSSLLSVCALIQLLWPTEVSAGILCGTKPPGFTCGTWTCIEGSWELVPKPAGTSCKDTEGYAGTCNGTVSELCQSTVSTGTVYPNFYVTHVVYAPPGVSSSVSYEAGNAYGSTTTTEGSFKAGTSVSVSNSGGFLFFAQGGLTLTAGREWGSSDTKSTDVTTRYTSIYTKFGAQNGINHDNDEIWFIVGPAVQYTIKPATSTLPQKKVVAVCFGPTGVSILVFCIC